ncbi:MAG: hypothetical protein ACMG55_08625 [Microcoleus sp.]
MLSTLRSIRTYASSLVLAILVMGIGIFSAFVLINWSDTSSGSWWIGSAGLLAVLALCGGVYMATSTKTSDWLGFAIVIFLLIVDSVLVGVFHLFQNWSWGQFGYGLMLTGLVLASTALVAVHKKYL